MMVPDLGVIWEVLPRDTSWPRIALGHSSNADTAAEQVEKAMADAGDAALFGMVISPDGTAHVCRRKTTGAFWWSDPFSPEA